MMHPAYFAGIIDGEGSIFSRGSNPHITCANTYEPLMLELHGMGGHMLRRQRDRSIGNLPAWDWAISGEKAAILLRWCLPYLFIKRDKALEALETWESRPVKREAFTEKARQAMEELGFGSWLHA